MEKSSEKLPSSASPIEDSGPEPELQDVVEEPANEPDVVPNGGSKAWIQVIGTFFIFFNTWGIINTFGAYQTYYESGELFSASSSNISWIGAVQSSLLLLCGVLTGPLYDAGYFKTLVYGGVLLINIGQMMLSLCHEYWQALLAQGFCIGIGTGIAYIPGVALLSGYFTTKLPIANGIATTGSGLGREVDELHVVEVRADGKNILTGGILYPIMFHRLLDRIGFAWTVRALGLVMIVTSIIPLLIFRPRPRPPSKRRLIDLTAFKEPAYTSFVLGAMLTSVTINIPFYYIQYYAISTGVASNELGFYFLSIMTTGSFFGRVLPNLLANRVGPFNIIFLCTLMSGCLTFAFVDNFSLAGVVASAFFFGFFSGAYVSLPPTCFVRLSPTRSVVGTRMGMGFAVAMLGNLLGAPLAGVILREKGFNAMWIFGGASSILGAFALMMSRNIQGKWKLLAML
ncbi:Endoglucanase-1 [Purpureocillium lavendulum]|uniref:Endoglucanase-1 n=1 Tax=Purpureocillium lavendulum TaxID=1247861 RepID=A0AB34FGN9_9HYPO|nr:Endoglucanase-1 [Purpureocillium lavendulum]